jgi:hypothetical protein
MDRHRVDADSDPDPTFHCDADPDPNCILRFTHVRNHKYFILMSGYNFLSFSSVSWGHIFEYFACILDRILKYSGNKYKGIFFNSPSKFQLCTIFRPSKTSVTQLGPFKLQGAMNMSLFQCSGSRSVGSVIDGPPWILIRDFEIRIRTIMRDGKKYQKSSLFKLKNKEINDYPPISNLTIATKNGR